MDLTNILNTREGGATAASAPMSQSMEAQNHVYLSTREHNPRSPAPSEFISDREGSPHSSVSPSASEHSYSMRSVPPHPHLSQMNGSYGAATPPDPSISPSARGPGRPSSGDPSAKAFPCSVCGKGFARRSDLARHERIHSGVRPHVCEHPGCDKQFIQRSALTVHARVHTGEKPHMCETCGKPFSDSSSLARHRRIHSGKRPYKCPYADCQKTFTRRTTLTRHQNHHTGTISEAAAATAAALAARPSLPKPGRPPRSPSARPFGGYGSGSEPSSANSTPSPHQRNASLSPGAELPPPFLRQNDFTYRSNGNFTSHPGPLLTAELHPLTPRPTPTTTPTIPSVLVPGMNRQPPTSNPNLNNPYMQALPPILEPSAKPDMQRAGSPHLSGSPHLTGSPHMSTTSPLLSRGGSPHLSASTIGSYSPSYPSSAVSADEPMFFPPPPPSIFQHSGSPEPGLHYNDNYFRKQPDIGLNDSQERKITTTTC